MQLAIHVVQNRRAGEQKSLWDKTNKENYHLKLCMSFACFVPVRLLLSSVAVLYHVNGWLQRTYFDTFLGVYKYFFKNLHLVIYNENKNSSFHFRWKIYPKRANFASHFLHLTFPCNLYRYTLNCQYLLKNTMESNWQLYFYFNNFLPTFARIR